MDFWGSSCTPNHSICNEDESYGRLVSQKFLQISWPRKERPEKENQAIHGQEIILAFLRLEKETGTTVNRHLSLARTHCQGNVTRMPFQRGNLASSGQTRAPWFTPNYRVTATYTVCVSGTMSSVLIARAGKSVLFRYLPARYGRESVPNIQLTKPSPELQKQSTKKDQIKKDI